MEEEQHEATFRKVLCSLPQVKFFEQQVELNTNNPWRKIFSRQQETRNQVGGLLPSRMPLNIHIKQKRTKWLSSLYISSYYNKIQGFKLFVGPNIFFK